MKKQLLLLMLIFLPMMANAKDVVISGIYYSLITKSKEAEVIENPNKYKGKITIPSKVVYEGDEYNVTSIGNNAFGQCQITSIALPNSIIDIKGGAFVDCENLSSIVMSQNVQSIGNMAFYNCEKLTSIFIPKSLSTIGKTAFSGCRGLKAVHIEDIESWCNINFEGGDSSNPLGYARHLYKDGEEITNIVIPEDVKSIGKYAFVGCESFTTLTILEGVSNIGDFAFSNCSNLTTITLPKSLQTIDDCAFGGCEKIESLYIPQSVSNINKYAFSGCSALNNITVENSNPIYDSRNNCNALIETSTNLLFVGTNKTIIPNGIKSIADGAFNNRKSLSSIIIPNSVTDIGNTAFYGCSNITILVLGSAVSSIGSGAFSACEELKDVYCYANTLPMTKDNFFKGSYINYAILHVPSDAINSYMAAEPWKNFKEIVALTDADPNPTGIMTIETLNNEIKSIYDLNGRQVINTQKGIYIINGKKKIVK